MATFDSSHLQRNARYRVLPTKSLTGLSKVKGAFGMGSCAYKNKLYYFFGGLGYNKRLKTRDNTSQVIEYDPDMRHFEPVVVWHNQQRLLTERRCVTSMLFDRHVLSLGGIDKHGNNISEFLCIDMETKQWKDLQILNPKEGPGPLNSSAMCLVAYKEREVLQYNNLSEIQWDHVTQEIEKEGIFVFGGLKGEQPDIKIKDNNLYMLSIGNKKHSWSVIKTTGR